MNSVKVVYFCILYYYAYGKPDDDFEEYTQTQDRLLSGVQKNHKSSNDQLDVKQYQAELAAGDHSEFLGSNFHFSEPQYYKDLGRRFVPVYPYMSKVQAKNSDPDEIFKYIQSPKKVKHVDDGEIIPVRAPPEVVLAVMLNSKKQAESNPQPSDPTEEVIREYMLRSGDYWNDVVKEDVDPDFILRTNKRHKQKYVEGNEGLFRGTQAISAKLLPGTKLYNLLAEIVKKSPRLVYIINDQ